MGWNSVIESQTPSTVCGAIVRVRCALVAEDGSDSTVMVPDSLNVASVHVALLAYTGSGTVHVDPEEVTWLVSVPLVASQKLLPST
jgi:hypothetical protein